MSVSPCLSDSPGSPGPSRRRSSGQGCRQSALERRDEPADVEPVHEGVVGFDRERHRPPASDRRVASQDESGNRVGLARSRVPERREPQPGQDGAVDDVVTLGLRVQPGIGATESLQQRVGVRAKRLEALVHVEVGEDERLVLQEHGAGGMRDVVDDDVVAADPHPELLGLVESPHGGPERGEEERRSVVAADVHQSGDVDRNGDVPERVVEAPEELVVLPSLPGLQVEDPHGRGL